MVNVGYSEALQRRVRAVPRDAKVYTEAIVVESEDVRATADEAAAATLTNCTALDDGSIVLTATSTGLISYASGSDAIATLTQSGAFHVLAFQVDEAVPDGAKVRSIQCHLSRRRVAANPMFDGDWVLRVYRLPALAQDDGVWQVVPTVDALKVPAASMTTDTELVTFNFTGSANDPQYPEPLTLDQGWRPFKGLGPNFDFQTGARTLVFAIAAHAGTNTNYAWMSDAGASADVTTANVGTFAHRLAAATTLNLKQALSVTTATGMLRATININAYATNGAVTYTYADLGASPTETVEFVAKAAAPNGSSITLEARVTTTDAYVTILDGQTLADVGLATSQTYQLHASLVASTALNVSPVLYELGVRSRTVTDWTDEAHWSDEAESVDPRTGQGRMGQATLAVMRTGDRDYRGPEKLLSEQNFTDVEVRRYIGHPDLDRSDWLFCDLWRLDDYRLEEDRLVLTCVSVLEQLGGKYPAPAGSLTGYLVKSAAASNLSTGTGASFTQELSQITEAVSTVSFTVSASLATAAEESYAYTAHGVPNLTWWPDGAFTVKVKALAATTNVYCKVRVTRVSATGTVAEATGTAATNLWTEAQLLSAASTFVFTSTKMVWAVGAASDRLRVDYGFYITTGTAAATVVLEIGGTGSEVIPPWLPTTQAVPETYSAESPASCWSDWVSNVVAVPARYRGSGPANTSDKLSKNVFNADGRRELERIAFADGGCVIARQGRIEYANLYKPRSPVRAAFTIEEYTMLDASLGFRDRLPEFAVPYGFDGGKFVGQIVTQHAAALAAYGLSSIDQPDARLEDETAKWLPGPKLAGEIGRNVVQAMGAGFMTLHLGNFTVSYPELTIGDGVMVETDRLAVLDVETGQSIRGPVWCYGIIIGRSGVWPDELTVWVRGLAGLFDVSQSNNAREPFEPIIVQCLDMATMGQTAVADPTRAEFQFRVFPSDASVYYAYATATETLPDRVANLAAWTAYTSGTTVQLLRATGSTKYLHFFGTRDGIYGPTLTVPVLGRAPLPGINLIDNVDVVQSGSSPSISVTAVVDPAGIGDARRVIAYSFVAAFGVVPINSEQYFLAERVVGGSSDWNRFTNATACSSGDVVSWQFAAVDENGNVVEDGAGSYTVVTSTATAAESVTMTNITWSVTATGTTDVTRKYGFAWGVSTAVTDATHDLQITWTLDGVTATLTTIASPATTTVSVTGVDSGYVVTSTEPRHRVAFAWQLLSGASVVNSGTILDGSGNLMDRFNGAVNS